MKTFTKFDSNLSVPEDERPISIRMRLRYVRGHIILNCRIGGNRTLKHDDDTFVTDEKQRGVQALRILRRGVRNHGALPLCYTTSAVRLLHKRTAFTTRAGVRELGAALGKKRHSRNPIAFDVAFRKPADATAFQKECERKYLKVP